MTAKRTLLTLLLGLALLPGCAPRATTFVRPDVDFGRIRRCAVLPFRNLTQDQGAAERVQSVFLTELLRRGEGLQIVEMGETISALRELRLSAGEPLPPARLVELGKRLGAEGVFAGGVLDYGVEQGGQNRVTLVTAEFTLSETETGSLIWKSEVHGKGTSLWRKLFGGEPASLYAVTRDVVGRALGTLF